MEGLGGAVRRSFMGLVLAVVGQFVFDGFDIFGTRSDPLRAVEVILAILLLFGLIPRSFLSPVFRWLSERITQVARWRGILIVIAPPLLLVVFQVYFASGDLAILRRIGDPRIQISLWHSLAMGLIQMVILALNIMDVTRSSSRSIH